MQLAILAERRMAPRPVDRNAEELSAEILKFRKHLIVKRHLITADRAPVSRIKCEHNRLPAKLAQPGGLVWCAVEAELRSRGSRSQRRTLVILRGSCFHGMIVIVVAGNSFLVGDCLLECLSRHSVSVNFDDSFAESQLLFHSSPLFIFACECRNVPCISEAVVVILAQVQLITCHEGPTGRDGKRRQHDGVH